VKTPGTIRLREALFGHLSLSENRWNNTTKGGFIWAPFSL